MYYEGEEVKPKIARYMNNRIALLLQDTEGYPYGTVTVNIEDSITNERCSYIDVNNMGDDIIDFLDKNHFGELTGRMGMSGFCIYPEYEFNQDIIDKYERKD